MGGHNGPARRCRVGVGNPRIDDQDGTDIVLTGSISLAHDLLQARLVDELRLFTFPLVLGRGRRLFPEGGREYGLELIEEQTCSGGVTLTRHAL